MPSNFLEFNQGLPQLDKWKSPEEQIRQIVNYIRSLTEQLRYEFRHINVPDHDAGKITSGIISIERGGTGAANAKDARAKLGIGGSVEETNLVTEPVSIASGAWRTMGGVRMDKGVWLVTVDVSFAESTTGRRAVSLNESVPEGTNSPVNGVQAAPSPQGNTMLQVVRLIQTSGTELKVGVFQSSGSVINVNRVTVRTLKLCD